MGKIMDVQLPFSQLDGVTLERTPTARQVQAFFSDVLEHVWGVLQGSMDVIGHLKVICALLGPRLSTGI